MSRAGPRSERGVCRIRAATAPAGSPIRRPRSPAARCRWCRFRPRIFGRCSAISTRSNDIAMSETAAVPADRRAAEERVALDRTWSRPAGLYGRLCAADHKTIGIRYLVTAFGFFLLAGLLAAAMRLQLSRPENAVLGPDSYNQAFTTHGTIMMFLFAVPIMQGLGVYFVPLMVGTREIAFPRLNAFSYWVYLFGGLMLLVAFALDIGPDAGWFAYVPLSGPEYSPGKRTDFWAQMITFTELAALAVAVQLITTIFKQRAPGHVAEPHAGLCLGAARHLVHGRVRDALGHGGEQLPDH